MSAPQRGQHDGLVTNNNVEDDLTIATRENAKYVTHTYEADSL